MILSFHPNIVGHENILCAGRLPNEEDLAAIRRSQAVILSQGCSEALYKMCAENCDQVFPNYNARFNYPGKLGQAGLFQEVGVLFPRTCLFETVSAYYDRNASESSGSPLGFPCVFKSDLGGEGEGVSLIRNSDDLDKRLQKATISEKSGQKGFLLQEYVSCGARSLRVVVIGEEFRSYWRIQHDTSQFLTSIQSGAVIDHDADGELQDAGINAVQGFCLETGINLAGFDLLFAQDEKKSEPIFLEINYFFGRRGLGGSSEYYKLVNRAVNTWLSQRGLSL